MRGVITYINLSIVLCLTILLKIVIFPLIMELQQKIVMDRHIDKGTIVEIEFYEPPIVRKKLIHRVKRIKCTGLLIRKMNGRKPFFFDNTIYATPGLITIDFEYFEKYQSSGFSRSYGQSSYTFRGLPGRSYMITFNYENKDVELSELI